MSSQQPLGSAIDAACAPSPGRDLDLARSDARRALERYANLLRRWNDPDDDHTRHSLRAMVERVIDEEFSS